jgi:hypothetical protein
MYIAHINQNRAPHQATNMATVDDLDGTAYIPFKTDTVEPKDAYIWAKMYHLFMYNQEAFM